MIDSGELEARVGIEPTSRGLREAKCECLLNPQNRRDVLVIGVEGQTWLFTPVPSPFVQFRRSKARRGPETRNRQIGSGEESPVISRSRPRLHNKKDG